MMTIGPWNYGAAASVGEACAVGGSAAGEGASVCVASGIGNGGDVYGAEALVCLGLGVGRGLGVERTGVGFGGGGGGSGVMRGSGKPGSVATLTTCCRFQLSAPGSEVELSIGVATGVAAIAGPRSVA